MYGIEDKGLSGRSSQKLLNCVVLKRCQKGIHREFIGPIAQLT